MEPRKKGINDPLDYSWLRSNKVMKSKFHKLKDIVSEIHKCKLFNAHIDKTIFDV